MNILFVGDVFGSAGRHIVREHLPHVLETNDVDLLVINGENAAGGFGLWKLTSVQASGSARRG